MIDPWPTGSLVVFDAGGTPTEELAPLARPDDVTAMTPLPGGGVATAIRSGRVQLREPGSLEVRTELAVEVEHPGMAPISDLAPLGPERVFGVIEGTGATFVADAASGSTSPASRGVVLTVAGVRRSMLPRLIGGTGTTHRRRRRCTPAVWRRRRLPRGKEAWIAQPSRARGGNRPQPSLSQSSISRPANICGGSPAGPSG